MNAVPYAQHGHSGHRGVTNRYGTGERIVHRTRDADYAQHGHPENLGAVKGKRQAAKYQRAGESSGRKGRERLWKPLPSRISWLRSRVVNFQDVGHMDVWGKRKCDTAHPRAVLEQRDNKAFTGATEALERDGGSCYEKDGTAYLNLEAVARGLGFTTTQTIDGKEYVNVRWKRVGEYLAELGFATCGKRPDFIPPRVSVKTTPLSESVMPTSWHALAELGK